MFSYVIIKWHSINFEWLPKNQTNWKFR